MTGKIPRGKTPSLIGSTNGRPRRVLVKKKSICCRCGCDIPMGGECYGIPKLGRGFSNAKRHCKECYLKIIEQTERDIAELRSL